MVQPVVARERSETRNATASGDAGHGDDHGEVPEVDRHGAGTEEEDARMHALAAHEGGQRPVRQGEQAHLRDAEQGEGHRRRVEVHEHVGGVPARSDEPGEHRVGDHDEPDEL